MDKFSKYVISCVTTARMGSCWCGDCCCLVYADGSIKYGVDSDYDWMKSEQYYPTFGHCEGRVKDLEDVENKEMRPYYSNLRKSDYESALRCAYNNPAAFKGSDEDWAALQRVVATL